MLCIEAMMLMLTEDPKNTVDHDNVVNQSQVAKSIIGPRLAVRHCSLRADVQGSTDMKL